MRVITYDDINREEWGRLVRESTTGTWFQTPEAYAFFASMPDLFEPFVVAVGEHKLRGVCVGYVTKESSKVKQYFTRRAIILGGPALADDATEKEVEMLMNGVRKHLEVEAPIYIETRNFNDYSPWREAFEKAGFAYKKHLNFHVRPADFELRLSDNRKRQWHKIEAQNAHLEVRDAKDAEELSAWYRILSELYRRKVKTPLLPEKFFMNAYTSRAAQFLVVVYDGKVIGGSMLAMDERCVYEWYECGLNSSYKEQYPSVAATCAGIRYAQEQGCTRYDMMGAGEPGVPYGVRDFKSEFGGEMVEHGRYLCICKPGLYKLGTLGVRILKRSK